MNMCVQTLLNIVFSRKYVVWSLSLVVSLWLFACSSVSLQNSAVTEAHTVPDAIKSNKTTNAGKAIAITEVASLDGQTMFEVMMAQMALDRGLYQDALYLFEQSALRTKDQQLLVLTLELAHQLKRTAVVDRLLLIWLQSSNISEMGLIIAMQHYLQQGQLVDFSRELQRWHRLKNPQYNLLDLAQYLPLDIGYMSELSGQFQQLAAQLNLPALLTLASLAEQNAGEFSSALRVANLAINRLDNPLARLIKYQILQQRSEGDINQFVLDSYQTFPEHPSWVLLRLQPLLERADFALAAQILKPAVAVNSQNERLQMMYAQVNLQLQNYEKADVILQRLIQSKQYQDEAIYKLGVIAMQQDKSSQAQQYFSQVRYSIYWQRAQYFLIQLQWQQHNDPVAVMHHFDQMLLMQAEKSADATDLVDVYLLESNFGLIINCIPRVCYA